MLSSSFGGEGGVLMPSLRLPLVSVFCHMAPDHCCVDLWCLLLSGAQTPV